jgi:hypothetical protein
MIRPNKINLVSVSARLQGIGVRWTYWPRGRWEPVMFIMLTRLGRLTTQPTLLLRPPPAQRRKRERAY